MVREHRGSRRRRAQEGAQPLPTRPREEHVQGVRGGGALPAPAPEEDMQGVRAGGLLPAFSVSGAHGRERAREREKERERERE